MQLAVMGGENAERDLSLRRKEITVSKSEHVCHKEKKIIRVC
jgi:hypothetical protein